MIGLHQLQEDLKMYNAFVAMYEYGPHQGDTIHILALNQSGAYEILINYLKEEFLWARVGSRRNISMRQINYIPPNSMVIF